MALSILETLYNANHNLKGPMPFIDCPHNYIHEWQCSLCQRPRNKEILELCRSGMTLKAVGDIYGLSPERIRQIKFKMLRLENRMLTTAMLALRNIHGNLCLRNKGY